MLASASVPTPSLVNPPVRPAPKALLQVTRLLPLVSTIIGLAVVVVPTWLETSWVLAGEDAYCSVPPPNRIGPEPKLPLAKFRMPLLIVVPL